MRINEFCVFSSSWLYFSCTFIYRAQNLIWHGAHISGRSSHRNCKDWTSNDTSEVGISADFLFKYMLHQHDENCGEKLVVLCIEIPRFVVDDFFSQERRSKDAENSYTDASNDNKANEFYLAYEEHKQLLSAYYN